MPVLSIKEKKTTEKRPHPLKKKYNTYDFFSSGSYGCTMYPFMKCDGKKTVKSAPNMISKLSVNNEYSENEYHIGKRLKYLKEQEEKKNHKDPSRSTSILDHMNFVERKCSIRKKNLHINHKKYECSILQNKKYKSNKEFTLFYMKYIPSQEMTDYLSKQFDIKIVLRYYYFALKCIQFLSHHNIVHHDMHLSNTIVDEQGDFHLIDFGIAIDMNKVFLHTGHQLNMEYIKHMFITYDPEWGHWPLEYHVMGYMLYREDASHPLTSSKIQNIIDAYYDKHTMYEKFIPNLSEFKKRAQIFLTEQFVTSASEKTKEEIMSDVIEHSWKTWDIYQTSFIVLSLIHMHKIENLDSIVELCKFAIHYDYKSRRRNADYHITRLKQILTQYKSTRDTFYTPDNIKRHDVSPEEMMQCITATQKHHIYE